MIKKLSLLLLSAGLITFAACKSKSKTVATTTTTTTTTTSPILAAADVSEEQVTFAQKRWAESNMEKLKAGKSIFRFQCTNCHKSYPIEGFSEKKWLHEIDDMSPKAKLSPEEKQNLTYYVLSYLDMRTAGK